MPPPSDLQRKGNMAGFKTRPRARTRTTTPDQMLSMLIRSDNVYSLDSGKYTGGRLKYDAALSPSAITKQPTQDDDVHFNAGFLFQPLLKLGLASREHTRVYTRMHTDHHTNGFVDSMTCQFRSTTAGARIMMRFRLRVGAPSKTHMHTHASHQQQLAAWPGQATYQPSSSARSTSPSSETSDTAYMCTP